MPGISELTVAGDRLVNLPAADRESELIDAVRVAVAGRRRLAICGNGTKAGPNEDGDRLDVAGHTGIIEYAPTEQTLTARAGTTVAEIGDVLAAHDQYLAAEPPAFGGRATLGGTLACNLSGPARPWSGSLRDQILGIRLINGRGECLRFGGRVMKNVAGYDVSRLQAGARGRYGVLTAITVRVHPLPATTETRVLDCTAEVAHARMLALGRLASPLSGASWVGGRLYLRFSGVGAAVGRAAGSTGGETLDANAAALFWTSLANRTHPFFTGDGPARRESVRAASPLQGDARQMLIDWGGNLRWHRDDAAGSHGAAHNRDATRDGSSAEWPLPGGPLAIIEERLRRAFDPFGVFIPANPPDDQVWRAA